MPVARSRRRSTRRKSGILCRREQGWAHGERKEQTMNQWMVRRVVTVVILAMTSTASAQMGKDGMGKSGMMGDGMMGGGMMSRGGGGGMGMGMMGMHGPGMEIGGMGEMMKMMR